MLGESLEAADLLFEPHYGGGEYLLYFLPYATRWQTYDARDDAFGTTYEAPSPYDDAPAAWRARYANDSAVPRARLRRQARPRRPIRSMERAATFAEAAALVAAEPPPPPPPATPRLRRRRCCSSWSTGSTRSSSMRAAAAVGGARPCRRHMRSSVRPGEFSLADRRARRHVTCLLNATLPLARRRAAEQAARLAPLPVAPSRPPSRSTSFSTGGIGHPPARDLHPRRRHARAPVVRDRPHDRARRRRPNRRRGPRSSSLQARRAPRRRPARPTPRGAPRRRRRLSAVAPLAPPLARTDTRTFTGRRAARAACGRRGGGGGGRRPTPAATISDGPRR